MLATCAWTLNPLKPNIKLDDDRLVEEGGLRYTTCHFDPKVISNSPDIKGILNCQVVEAVRNRADETFGKKSRDVQMVEHFINTENKMMNPPIMNNV